MDKITQILENVVRCKYFEVGVHIKNPIKNSYQGGLGRTTQTLDHVVVVHKLIWDKRKSQINEYSDFFILIGKGKIPLSVLMASVMSLHFSMQKEVILEHANGKCHLCPLIIKLSTIV